MNFKHESCQFVKSITEHFLLKTYYESEPSTPDFYFSFFLFLFGLCSHISLNLCFMFFTGWYNNAVAVLSLCSVDTFPTDSSYFAF